jgi:hypothetical protein
VEQENEGLRLKVQELTDLSFVKVGGAGFMSAGGAKGGFDLASSIDKMSEDIDINMPPSETEKYLQ